MFEEPPGSHGICEICDWQDDDTQLKFPDVAIGANHVSLVEAQKNFHSFGASDREHIQHVQQPTQEDKKDPEWRVIDLSKDAFEKTEIKDGKSYFEAVGGINEDLTKLYYWRR
tara:strand:- start:183 stop:521 length:339 start_codon:yes stop_codon:yes gene_type:complete